MLVNTTLPPATSGPKSSLHSSLKQSHLSSQSHPHETPTLTISSPNTQECPTPSSPPNPPLSQPHHWNLTPNSSRPHLSIRTNGQRGHRSNLRCKLSLRMTLAITALSIQPTPPTLPINAPRSSNPPPHYASAALPNRLMGSCRMTMRIC